MVFKILDAVFENRERATFRVADEAASFDLDAVEFRGLFENLIFLKRIGVAVEAFLEGQCTQVITFRDIAAHAGKHPEFGRDGVDILMGSHHTVVESLDPTLGSVGDNFEGQFQKFVHGGKVELIFELVPVAQEEVP